MCMKPAGSLCIVIPCYNEESVLPVTAPLFKNKIEEMVQKKFISDKSRILFVDDGSTDATWSIIKELSFENAYFSGIQLSRNRGHQNALLAGLMEAKEKYDITISLDCDGQDDINVMEDMVNAYKNGAEVVYGVRNSRESDTIFKRVTAEWFYKIMKCLGAEVIFNHADYRLLSAKVLKEFSKFNEVNLFLRGMIPLIGFNSTCVYYERHVRIAGKTHYPLRKMLSLAWNGITSLSVKPLHIITGLGVSISLSSFLIILWSIVMRFLEKTVAGWTSLICILVFLGGIQLICIGIIGEYVGKTYMEVKHRPRYIIEERTDCTNKEIL